MDEAEHQRLALQGGVALAEVLDADRAAVTSARRLQRRYHVRHRQAAARWRTDWRPRPEAPRPTASPVPPEQANVLSAWVQYVGSARHVLDISTAQREQHVDAEPLEVLCLPLETCSWLLAHQPAFWQAVSAVPDFLGVSHDGATGLDAAFLDAGNPWGVTTGVQPYFDTTCRLGDSERGRLIIVNGQPYLTTDETG